MMHKYITDGTHRRIAQRMFCAVFTNTSLSYSAWDTNIVKTNKHLDPTQDWVLINEIVLP